jgi:NitT/TauT family transport system permease protein
LIIWLGAFFPILINTIVGINRTNPTLVNVAKVLGADKKSTVLKVMIPSALPEIVAGMRIGLGVAWMCIMAAEMIGGEMLGLGRLILKYAELLRVDVILASMLTIGIIGLLMNEAFIRVENYVLRWRVEVRI